MPRLENRSHQVGAVPRVAGLAAEPVALQEDAFDFLGDSANYAISHRPSWIDLTIVGGSDGQGRVEYCRFPAPLAPIDVLNAQITHRSLIGPDARKKRLGLCPRAGPTFWRRSQSFRADKYLDTCRRNSVAHRQFPASYASRLTNNRAGRANSRLTRRPEAGGATAKNGR